MHSALKDYIWAADLADTQLIEKFNKGFRFLFCVTDISRKYAWVVPFEKILNDFNNKKPNKYG